MNFHHYFSGETFMFTLGAKISNSFRKFRECLVEQFSVIENCDKSISHHNYAMLWSNVGLVCVCVQATKLVLLTFFICDTHTLILHWQRKSNQLVKLQRQSILASLALSLPLAPLRCMSYPRSLSQQKLYIINGKLWLYAWNGFGLSACMKVSQ